MKLAFDEAKATQTAAAFLRLAGGQLQHLVLIKLLYKADREALRQLGLPITTDGYVSLKFGPVTSCIYDLIKASASPAAHPTFWSTHVTKRGSYHVALSSDPGDSELSRAENRIIAEIFASDGGKDGFTLAEETRRDFPEWKEPGESSTPIEISDIMAALGLTEDEIDHIESSISAQHASQQLAI